MDFVCSKGEGAAELMNIGVFRGFLKIANCDYFLHRICLSVLPSVRMEQLGFHWTGYNEIRYNNNNNNNNYYYYLRLVRHPVTGVI